MDTENKYGTLEIQQKLLVLLREFDSFCQNEEIKYSVMGGTLLGTIRHKGFIPWDDDLDVLVDRNNYNKLMQAIRNSNKLQVGSYADNALWVDRISLIDENRNDKVIMDLFIMDNCPDNAIFAKTKLLLIMLLQGMMKKNLSLEKGNLVLKACSFVTYVLGKFFSNALKRKWYKSVSQWGNSQHTCKYKKLYNDQWKGLKLNYPIEIMTEIKRFPFESIEINGLSHFDEYLHMAYGDYMTLPKVEDRVPQPH